MVLNLMIAAWLTGSFVMVLTWVGYVFTRIPNLVDMNWGPGIAVMYTAVLILKWGFQIPIYNIELWVSFLIWLWALRLGGFIWFTRIRNREIDARYLGLQENWGNVAWGYFRNYQIQAFLQVAIVSTPILLARSEGDITLGFWIGLVLFGIGLIGESVADFQSHRFRASNPRGEICKVGLWRISRHPNYFFEIVIWLAISVIVWSTTHNLAAFSALFTMIIVFYKITGPITEANSIKIKGDLYRAYQSTTPFIVPKFLNPVYLSKYLSK